jgi:glycosyltransferase involved in cell wall biosynthesis
MVKINPLVSVVVSSYTSERFDDLVDLLDSLVKQTYSDFETIVVVEKSQELYGNLREHIKETGYSNIRLLFNSGPEGLSSARNIGVKQARGEIIAFIDDDALASSDWLGEMVKVYSDNDNTIGVTGPINPLWEDESMDWCPKEYYWLFACTYKVGSKPHPVRNGYGANMSFRKNVLDKYGAFQTSLGSQGDYKPTTAEETEMSCKLASLTGNNIIYHPDVVVNHKVRRYRLNLKYIWERSQREGFSKNLIKKALNNTHNSKGFLDTEFSLLKSIIFNLIPNIAFGFFKCPDVSFRKLFMTIIILTGVSVGYLRGYFISIESMEVN